MFVSFSLMLPFYKWCKFSKVGGKMSRLPSVVTAIANEKGVSVRTVQRWLEAGKFKGVYRTRGRHWRLRKARRRQQWKENGKACWIKDGHRLRFPSREQWEPWKKSLVADTLRRLMVLVPYNDQAVKFAWLYAGITDDDVRAVLLQPDPFTRARNRAALKRRDYRKWQLLCQRKYVAPVYRKYGRNLIKVRSNRSILSFRQRTAGR